MSRRDEELSKSVRFIKTYECSSRIEYTLSSRIKFNNTNPGWFHNRENEEVYASYSIYRIMRKHGNGIIKTVTTIPVDRIYNNEYKERNI